MIRKLLFTVLMHSLLMTAAYAQDKQVSGRVTSQDDGSSIPGVNIVVQGTSKGTTTDADGNYTIQLTPSENTLVFTFVGFKPTTVQVDGRSAIDLAMEPDITSLDEIVVVGYGTQREKDLTSAITTIKTDEITKTPQGQAMQALQGKVPGLQIINSGIPGASPTVRVRGIGSMPDQGNSDPLYVVDGMFFSNIDFLNPGDIETMSVLKDASAASIYGVRAANGVILITTKSGSYNQKTRVSYNGYYGVQVAQNVLKMANSEQYTKYALGTGTTAEQTFVENSFRFYGRSRVNPNVPDVNTDWYDQVLQTGAIQNHSIGVDGGSEKVRYSLGATYFAQDGLLKITKNNYERLNFRTKLDFKASDRLTVGVHLNVSNARQYEADAGVWGTTYYAVPIMPVYDEANTLAAPLKLASAKRLGYRDSKNPFFNLNNSNNRNNIAKILGNFYAEYQIIPDKLAFKMAYNSSFESINERDVAFAYNDGYFQNQNALTRSSKSYFNQILDNTLTYTNNFGLHNLSVMAGYSYRSEVYERTFAKGTNIATLDRDREETWYLSSGPTIDINGTGDEGERLFGVSYLGRMAYNYDDRYLVYATVRREGTNKYSQTWGNFLTIGAGWVLSEESFFQVKGIDFLKLRGSWGQLGNDNVAPALGRSEVKSTSTAIGDVNTPGVWIDTNFDYVDRWETVYETNVGLTGRFLDNRLSADLDYYVRDTHDAVLRIKLPGSGEVIRRNGGQIRNTGFEATLGWSGTISSGLTYNIGANFATLKNTATDLRGQTYLDFGTAEFQQRTILNESINAFYGYEVVGVFQNAAEINSSGYTSEFIVEKNLQPGDFFFKDLNGDGRIDGFDRKIIGTILPNFTYGFNFGVSWKGFDLSANFQGMKGHSILNRKRGEINWTEDSNIDADLATNLWTGEGTSNKYPSAAGLRGTRKAWNNSMSTYLVEDGDYFRIQNVRLGYTVTDKEVLGVTLPKTTVSFTAERPVTLFNYNGFNPEVQDGIDGQTYPIPAVYTVGLNLTF